MSDVDEQSNDASEPAENAPEAQAKQISPEQLEEQERYAQEHLRELKEKLAQSEEAEEKGRARVQDQINERTADAYRSIIAAEQAAAEQIAKIKDDAAADLEQLAAARDAAARDYKEYQERVLGGGLMTKLRATVLGHSTPKVNLQRRKIVATVKKSDFIEK